MSKQVEKLMIEEETLQRLFVDISTLGCRSGLSPIEFVPVVKLYLDGLCRQLGLSNISVSLDEDFSGSGTSAHDPREEMH